MTKSFFVKPIDVIMPRGNRHWGVNSGDFGQITMPPAPSVFAGAFRSFISSLDKETFNAIVSGNKPPKPEFASVLGSLTEPGSFQISSLSVGIKNNENTQSLFLLPRDITVFEKDNELDIRYSKPNKIPDIIGQKSELPLVATLRAPSKKPVSRYFISNTGFIKYLNGETLLPSDLISFSNLWKKEMRVGVALDVDSRATIEGKLYSAETINFLENVGFIVKIDGADEILPDAGTISLGGDQRAAVFESIVLPREEINLKKIEQEGKFKLVLTVPAIFNKGWIPNLVEREGEHHFLNYKGCKAQLVCAAVSGYESLSGWNMVKNIPKTAMRTVPAGCVYWFDNLEGPVNVLKELVNNGLWEDNSDKQRAVEGYNRAVIATY